MSEEAEMEELEVPVESFNTFVEEEEEATKREMEEEIDEEAPEQKDDEPSPVSPEPESEPEPVHSAPRFQSSGYVYAEGDMSPMTRMALGCLLVTGIAIISAILGTQLS